MFIKCTLFNYTRKDLLVSKENLAYPAVCFSDIYSESEFSKTLLTLQGKKEKKCQKYTQGYAIKNFQWAHKSLSQEYCVQMLLLHLFE